ncbi:MAG: molybdopterin-dependent oxidoreductase [Actinomycetales bacterium]|nr:molybdopterin-dependent oxidoreductase [Actinomycetales bacterium]
MEQTPSAQSRNPEPGGQDGPDPPGALGPRTGADPAGDPDAPDIRSTAPVWAAVGVGSAVFGLGTAQVVAAFVGEWAAPVVAVGEAVIDRVPPWLKDAAIEVFGFQDKLALVVGTVAVLLVLSAVIGLVARRRPVVARRAVYALGAVAALAAITRPEATLGAPLPSLLGAAAGALALSGLGTLAGVPQEPSRGSPALPPEEPVLTGPDRRAILVAAAGVAGVGLLGTGFGRWLNGYLRRVDEWRAGVRLPVPDEAQRPIPPTVEVGVPGVERFRTPNADFFRIDASIALPRIDPEDWSLRVHGLVRREVRLDFADLLGRGLVERDVTLACVSNEVGGHLIGNATWLGARIAPLLAEASPLPEADMVLSTGADGWTCSTPLPVLTDSRDALLAVGMNGEPLPLVHGFPVRMVVPGLYGYVSATKWVVELEVTRFDRATAYWSSRGWSERAPVKTSARIDVPKLDARVRPGRVPVAGIAWAQHRGIRGVQVRVDDGPWRPATLAAEASVDTWRQWIYFWDATPGTHVLRVRAVDGTGAVQQGERSDPEPDGATGWHALEVVVE